MVSDRELVLDFFDATSFYKGREKAKELVSRMDQEDFDPRAVRLLLENVERWLSIPDDARSNMRQDTQETRKQRMRTLDPDPPPYWFAGRDRNWQFAVAIGPVIESLAKRVQQALLTPGGADSDEMDCLAFLMRSVLQKYSESDRVMLLARPDFNSNFKPKGCPYEVEVGLCDVGVHLDAPLDDDDKHWPSAWSGDGWKELRVIHDLDPDSWDVNHCSAARFPTSGLELSPEWDRPNSNTWYTWGQGSIWFTVLPEACAPEDFPKSRYGSLRFSMTLGNLLAQAEDGTFSRRNDAKLHVLGDRVWPKEACTSSLITSHDVVLAWAPEQLGKVFAVGKGLNRAFHHNRLLGQKLKDGARGHYSVKPKVDITVLRNEPLTVPWDKVQVDIIGTVDERFLDRVLEKSDSGDNKVRSAVETRREAMAEGDQEAEEMQID